MQLLEPPWHEFSGPHFQNFWCGAPYCFQAHGSEDPMLEKPSTNTVSMKNATTFYSVHPLPPKCPPGGGQVIPHFEYIGGHFALRSIQICQI